MRNCLAVLVLGTAGMLAFSSGLSAAAAPQAEAAKPQAAPAPEHDLAGVWNMQRIPSQRHFIGSTYTAEEPDMTAWGKAKFEATKPSNGPRTHTLDQTDDPVLKSCLPPGLPRIYLQPFPMQIVQTPQEVIFLYEYDHTVRHVYIDGRPHPSDLTPTYMGDSIGHWDGNTLVVDTIGFNEKTWLDRDGHVHSDQLHVVERFHRVDRDHMQIAITMTDPKALAKPWETTLYYELKPDWHIMEQVCTDNAGFLGFEK
jgi:hypothetical protein